VRERTRYREYETQLAIRSRSPRNEPFDHSKRWTFSSARAPAPASAMPAPARAVSDSRRRSTAAARVNTGIVVIRMVVWIAVVSARPEMKRIWLNETPRSA
jgi:hypothetical protein